MGNGLAIWFLANAIVFAILFFIWYRTSGKKAGVTMYDMGVSFDKKKTIFDWGIFREDVATRGHLVCLDVHPGRHLTMGSRGRVPFCMAIHAAVQ